MLSPSLPPIPLEARTGAPALQQEGAANPFLLNQDRAAQTPPLSKSEQVYQHVKELIMHYILKPGQKVNEDELANMLQTSRTPVREALRKLSSEGLISIYPKRYAEVTYFTPEMTKHLGTIRMAQDILSGHLAIYYGSDAEFAQLQKLADVCEAAAQSGDLYGRVTADRNFHLKIAEIGKNEILLRYQQEVYLRVHLIQLQYTSLEDDTDKRISCHANIIQALTSRDETLYINTICMRCQEMYGLDPKIVDLYRR